MGQKIHEYTRAPSGETRQRARVMQTEVKQRRVGERDNFLVERKEDGFTLNKN